MRVLKVADATDHHLTLEHLLDLPAHATHVLTVNNRLSRNLVSRYSRVLTSRSGALPRVQPWGSWLVQAAFDLTFAQPRDGDPVHVLSATAAKILWAETVSAHDPDSDTIGPLIDIDQLASLAMQADELMLHWGIEVDPAWVTPEHQQFLLWQRVYCARLQALQAIDRCRIALHMPEWIGQARIAMPEHIVLAGFTQCSPAMLKILQACEQMGARVHQFHAQPPPSAHPPRQVMSPSRQHQWHQAIEWARHSLEQMPQGRFAIVVPDLQASADQARRLVHGALGKDHAFNVAVAPALAQWPLARAMLGWLSVIAQLMVTSEVGVEQVGRALHGGYCAGGSGERSVRAMTDVRWRRLQKTIISQADWHEALESLPELRQAWSDVESLWRSMTGAHVRTWHDWSALFRQTLAALGFPGPQSLSSVEFQVLQSVDRLFAELAGLDDLCEPTDLQQALERLQALARFTLFQPQRDRSARLDVLGLLEAEAGQWDGVWIMDLTDSVLPSAASPNPLIPRQALALANAPRSTPQREREWARQLFQALTEIAPSVTMSWPVRDEQQTLRASPLLAGLPFYEPPESPVLALPAKTALQTWVDGACPALLTDERISGGVALLDTQARNPMWAFVRHRLHTRALEPYARVPSRSQRGTFLHAVMRAVWDHLKTHGSLIESLADAGFKAWLGTTVDRLAHLMLVDWPAGLVGLEKQRTLELVLDWLALEAERPAFATAELEVAHHLDFGQIVLKVVLDRVDQDAHDHLILIDYKTGTSRPEPAKDWMRDPPVELQMVAYARALMASKGRWPDAIVWGQLHPRHLATAGICRPGVDMPGVKPFAGESEQAWQQHLESWNQSIEHLAAAFASGQADNVSWKLTDLKYCDIGAILRLHEEPADD